MGHKVHPYGFRIGIIREWQGKWYDDKHYAQLLWEDLELRRVIDTRCAEGGISGVEVDHQGNEVLMTVYSSRPGIVIGRGGQHAEELRADLEAICGKRVRLSIKEVEQPELDAHLIAQGVADKLERRMAFRRVMKQTAFRTMQAGAKGVKISCAGRLGGIEIARRETTLQGRLPLHTLCADIDYGLAEAHTAMGHIGVKVWVYKGDILPEVRRESVTAEASEVS